MSAKGNYLSTRVLQGALGGTGLTIAGHYVALTTSTPGATDTGSTIAEPTDANYTRVSASGIWTFGTPPNGATNSLGALSGFFVAGAAQDGNSISSIAIVDTSTKHTGNLLYFGDITGGPVPVNANDTVSIPASSIVITEN
jgi:hypothetical protein